MPRRVDHCVLFGLETGDIASRGLGDTRRAKVMGDCLHPRIEHEGISGPPRLGRVHLWHRVLRIETDSQNARRYLEENVMPCAHLWPLVRAILERNQTAQLSFLGQWHEGTALYDMDLSERVFGLPVNSNML